MSTRTNKFLLQAILLRLLLPFLILAGWELLYRVGLVNADSVSSPSRIIAKFAELVLNGQLLVNAGYSLYLIICAFLLSCLLAVPLGVAMGASELVQKIFDPLVELLRPLPPLALLPLAIVWLGIGISEKLFILIVGTFPPILINSFHGVRSADRVLIQAAKSMGATDIDVLWKVLIPSALPDIFVGMRIGMGFAFTVIVAAELVATQNGLGYLLTIGWRTYSVETIFVSIMTIAGLASLMDLILRYVRRRVIRWEVDYNAILGDSHK